MNKTQINLDLILPEAPDEKDECIDRIIYGLQNKRGIDKVHLIPANGTGHARLCFHYDPDEITVKQVEDMARDAGAALTEQYGHLLLSVSGIRHSRHARILEERINSLPGVQNTSASITGFIQLEFKKNETSTETILNQIKDIGLRIRDARDFCTHPVKILKKSPVRGHKRESHQPSTPHTTVEKKKQAPAEEHEHEHHHGGIFGEKTEMIFAIISGGFLLAGFIISFLQIPGFISIVLYVIAYIFGGFYTTKEAVEGLRKREFEIDFLMLVAAVGAAILGHWAEGALLLFLFSLGHSLEHFAMKKAKKSITALAQLTPKMALLKKGADLKEVAIEELKKGDVIVIKPHTKVAADGFVIRGKSDVNQAPITGESIPADKVAVDIEPDFEAADKLDEKHKVFAGTINGAGALEVKVSKLASDSTIARLITLVNEAQTQKSSTQNFTTKIEKYYVPGVLLLVLALLFAFLVLNEPFSASFYRAMAVLVAASPCALAISTPSAVLSGVARAARSGVLIKGGKPLEELGSVSAIAFDKTGTLTEGKPRLTGVHPLNEFAEPAILEMMIAAEKLSDHPLGTAMVKGAIEKLGRDVEAAQKAEAIQGRGIKAFIGQDVIHIGNKELFLERNEKPSAEILDRIEQLEGQGNTTMILQKNGTFAGIITLMDVPRPETKDTVAKLRHLGIKKMVMLTGDNQKVAESVAEQTGIEDAWGNLLPAQKVEAIENLKQHYPAIAMVGDGVNDAPAMARSTVGIAMGAAGSDVALETADIALMADKLNKLPFALGLSKKAKKIIRQNLIISLGMVVILLPLTISGVANIGPAVVGHEGSTLIVVFNALRLLAYK